jgi:hypothetical protein
MRPSKSRLRLGGLSRSGRAHLSARSWCRRVRAVRSLAGGVISAAALWACGPAFEMASLPPVGDDASDAAPMVAADTLAQADAQSAPDVRARATDSGEEGEAAGPDGGHDAQDTPDAAEAGPLCCLFAPDSGFFQSPCGGATTCTPAGACAMRTTADCPDGRGSCIVSVPGTTGACQ